MSELFVLSITHLKGRPKANQALALLQRIVSLVKPIMRKHGWKLPVLAEFFPESPNLLGMNVNGGQKILIRLRPPFDPDTFFPEGDLLHTMLHELTHNVHGPHDETFYKFLSGLEEELEALQRSGYAGEGFHSKGNRLGKGVSHDLPPHRARQRALEAAEKRREVGGMMSGGGRLGGGALSNLGLTPRELALLAAERRALDEKACGSGAQAQKEADKAAEDSVQGDVIDLTGDSDDEDAVRLINSSSTTKSHQSAESTSLPINRKPPCSSRRAPAVPPISVQRLVPALLAIPDGPWSCSSCTLLNEPKAFQCELCLSPRPHDSSASGWTCTTCGEQGISHQLWTCGFCGTVKSESTAG